MDKWTNGHREGAGVPLELGRWEGFAKGWEGFRKISPGELGQQLPSRKRSTREIGTHFSVLGLEKEAGTAAV